MEDQQRKSDFEQSAHESWRWIMEGEGLIQAADCLQTEGNSPEGIDMLAPMLFLRAMGLENLIKGLYVKYGKSVTDGHGNLNFHKHQLLYIYTIVNTTPSDTQKNTLKKLSDAIYSWGRYPVPMHYKHWRKDVAGITGLQPVFTWTKEDEDTYSEILKEVRVLSKDQNKGQKLPAWYK